MAIIAKGAPWQTRTGFVFEEAHRPLSRAILGTTLLGFLVGTDGQSVFVGATRVGDLSASYAAHVEREALNDRLERVIRDQVRAAVAHWPG
jgi:hypothetical protein